MSQRASRPRSILIALAVTVAAVVCAPTVVQPPVAGAASLRSCAGAPTFGTASGLRYRVTEVRVRRGFSCGSGRSLLRSYYANVGKIGTGGFLRIKGRYCLIYSGGRRVRCTRSFTSRGPSGPVVLRWKQDS